MGCIYKKHKCVASLVEGEKLEVKMKKLETQYSALQVMSSVNRLGTKEVRNLLTFTFLLFSFRTQAARIFLSKRSYLKYLFGREKCDFLDCVF